MALSDRVGKGRSYPISTNQTNTRIHKQNRHCIPRNTTQKPVYSDVLHHLSLVNGE